MVNADTLGKYTLTDKEIQSHIDECIEHAESIIIGNAKLGKTTATINVELCIQDDSDR